MTYNGNDNFVRVCSTTSYYFLNRDSGCCDSVFAGLLNDGAVTCSGFLATLEIGEIFKKSREFDCPGKKLSSLSSIMFTRTHGGERVAVREDKEGDYMASRYQCTYYNTY